MTQPTLYGLAYSPWTERARWALDHVGFDYHFQSYIPGISEPRLRMRLRRFRGPVTVPVLFGLQVYEDSSAIAELAREFYAGRGERSKAELEAIEAWLAAR